MRDWIVGNYVVQRKLGAGPFCETYLGEIPASKSQVILKRVHPALVAIPKICVRLRAQAISPPKLEHGNISPLQTILLDRDDVWIITGRATGVPFEDTLSAPKEPTQVGPAFARLLDAFDYAHRHGWIHADLKSSNLWIEPTGEFAVLDFATCRLFGYTPATRDLLGVDAYRSPEQVADEDIDAQSDLYSLGRILQRMLGGVSGPLDAVIRTATAQDRERRYRTAAEFRDALLRSLPQTGPVAEPHLPEPEIELETMEESFAPMEPQESFLDRLRKPLRSIFARNGHSNGHVNGNGHAANGHQPLIEHSTATPPPEPEPPPPPAVSTPPAPPPRMRSLRETLASEMVDFEFSANGSSAAPPKSKAAVLLEQTIEFEPPAITPQPAPPAPPADYADLVDSGFDAFRTGDYPRARDLWKRAQSIDSTNRLLNYNLRVVERKLAGNSR